MPLSTRYALAFAALAFSNNCLAVNGGNSGNKPFVYTAGTSQPVKLGMSKYSFSGASYQYTGLGAAECSFDFAPDGSLVYSPAFTTAGNGLAISHDQGATWTQSLPDGAAGTRTQIVFRQENERYFYWSSNPLGFSFQYSDNQGASWSSPLNGSHFDKSSQDWAKLVSGKPAYSKLAPGVNEIMYYSAPSFISTPLPVQPLGPVKQVILKSTDRGSTWTETGGQPTLNPNLSGGSCAGVFKSLATQELIIWGDGFVTPNGTVMYGLRRCQKLSVAVSDDEGDTWILNDVPGSMLPPFIIGDITYLFNGNVLVPEPISMDADGNIYAIWVDNKYVLHMSKSTDYARTWSDPVVIGAPGNGTSTGQNLMAYLPIIRQHPTTVGRAALAYYGSADGGKTYQGYVAETGNLNAAFPTFEGIISNAIDQPLQNNTSGEWDSGYGDPAGDLIEFMDVRYAPTNSGFGQDTIVAAWTRSMCSAHSVPPAVYNKKSCVPGWNYTAHANSRWQGLITVVKH